MKKTEKNGLVIGLRGIRKDAMHVIKFKDVGSIPEYRGRIANRNKQQKYLDLGYEIVQVPVMVDNRSSANQETPPTAADLDYLMEIPEKKYQDGQKTKQLENDLMTYDVTGGIGKDLKSHTDTKISVFINEMTIWQFLIFKIFKKKLWENPPEFYA